MANHRLLPWALHCPLRSTLFSLAPCSSSVTRALFCSFEFHSFQAVSTQGPLVSLSLCLDHPSQPLHMPKPRHPLRHPLRTIPFTKLPDTPPHQVVSSHPQTPLFVLLMTHSTVYLLLQFSLLLGSDSLTGMGLDLTRESTIQRSHSVSIC